MDIKFQRGSDIQVAKMECLSKRLWIIRAPSQSIPSQELIGWEHGFDHIHARGRTQSLLIPLPVAGVRWMAKLIVWTAPARRRRSATADRGQLPDRLSILAMMTVGSDTVLLAVLASPPPETSAVLTTEAGALWETLTLRITRG